RPPSPPLFPSTTLFRSPAAAASASPARLEVRDHDLAVQGPGFRQAVGLVVGRLHLLEIVDLAAQLAAREQRSDLRISELVRDFRSEEHTSELQSPDHLV